MSFQFDRFEAAAGIEPERALNISLGAAQAPLWAAFYASAGLGAAWWWSTAWTRRAPNFDLALLTAPEPASPAEAYLEALDEAVCDMIEADQDEATETAEAAQERAEVAAETTVEASAEAAPEPAVPEVATAALQSPATEAAAEPLAYAADVDAPVVELVTLDPVVETPAEAAPKASRKKSPKTSD